MNKGVAAILVLGFGLVLGTIVVGFITLANNELNMAKHDGDGLRAFYLAEAAVEKALYELSKDENYIGEDNVNLGSGVYEVSVTTVDSIKIIDAIGYVPTKSSPRSRKEIIVEAKRSEQTFSIDSALTNAGAVSVSGDARIDGEDMTGIKYGGTIDIQKPENVTGNPPSSPGLAPSFQSLFGMTEDQMKALATVYTNPKTNVPSPANGIIWIEGSAQYSSSQWEGNGILIVTGSLTMTGGEFEGLIYVKGSTMMAGNAEIEGAILTQGAGQYTGTSSIEYNQEYINRAANYYPYEVVKWQES